jgi:hypothetical protein
MKTLILAAFAVIACTAVNIPVPNAPQARYQDTDFIALIHFNMVSDLSEATIPNLLFARETPLTRVHSHTTATHAATRPTGTSKRRTPPGKQVILQHLIR